MRRTALITGSSNGIGEAIVKELAKLDYELVVTGRSETDILRVVDVCEKLSPSGQRPLGFKANLEHEIEVTNLFEASMKHLGNRLDLLVNNAGFGYPVSHLEAENCYENFKRIHQINFCAAVRLALLAGPALKLAAELGGDCSSIINIGSIASLRPSQAMFAYDTSKAALNMFTQSLAVELGPFKVRVNCVTPGPIETKIIERSGFSLDVVREIASRSAPLGRTGQVEEVAQSVLFLADPKRAAYITGANLLVDGGTVLAPLRFEP